MTQQPLLFPESGPKPGRRKSLVIEAGAGTGKTTRIVREILEVLLDNPDLRPESIALVTFTEKAAAEIADRIRFALTDLHASFGTDRPGWPSDAAEPVLAVPAEKRDAWRVACEMHLRNIDRFRSQTIHSFCQVMLRAHAMEAGLNPQFEILAGAEAPRLLDRAWREWLELETRRDADPAMLREWEIVLQHFERLDSVREAIFAMHMKRDLVTDDSYTLGEISDAHGELVRTILAIQSHTAAAVESLTDPHALELVQYLRQTDPPNAPDLEAWIRYFEPVEQALEAVGVSKLKSFKDLARPLIDIEKKKIHDILNGHRAALATRALARRFIAYTDALKAREGVVDFDDLLLRAARLVEIPSVLADLRSRFEYIFVDEFQDTDRVQARIVDALSHDPSGRLTGRTMIVGDPKQGIYSFRRADPETYEATVQRFVANGARLEKLGRQFRSEPSLLRDLNAMFSALFSTPGTPSVARPQYGDDLEAGRAPEEERPRITFLRELPPATSDEPAEKTHVREARVIAAWIEREVREQDYKRFAILFRKMTNIATYLEALDRRKIPYLLPPARPLLERRAAVDAMAVIRAIAAPFERSAFVSAARTPYFGLTDDEIARDPYAKEEGSTMHALRREIGRYGSLARHSGVRDVLDTVVAEREIESLYAAIENGGDFLDDLERLRQIALEFDLREGGSLAEFVSEILRRRDEYDESEKTAIDESRNAVRIMTVHGAKGLEFDTVIIPDLAGRGGSSPIRVHAVETPKTLLFTGRLVPIAAMWREADGQRLHKVPGAREKAEVDRLFYVAVTRAKRDVVFVCDKFERSGFMPAMEATFGLEPKAIGALWKDGVASEIVDLPTANDRVIRARFEQLSREEAGESARKRFANDAWEPLAAAIAIDSIAPAQAAEPQLLETGEAIARRKAAGNRKAGTLLHRVLELWDGNASKPAALLERLAVEQAASVDDVARVRKRLERIVASKGFRRIHSADTVGREVPIFYLDEEGSPVEGRIDRIVRENGRAVIVDYKSGKSASQRRESDRTQVRAYCQAWSQISGEPCTGLLWYVEDDLLVDV